jgi:hypothetical protein
MAHALRADKRVDVTDVACLRLNHNDGEKAGESKEMTHHNFEF